MAELDANVTLEMADITEIRITLGRVYAALEGAVHLGRAGRFDAERDALVDVAIDCVAPLMTKVAQLERGEDPRTIDFTVGRSMEGGHTMKEILFRLGQVAWWFGALVALAAILGAGVALFNDGHNSIGGAGFVLAMGAVFTVPAWAVAFVLAGSFWRPPKATK